MKITNWFSIHYELKYYLTVILLMTYGAMCRSAITRNYWKLIPFVLIIILINIPFTRTDKK